MRFVKESFIESPPERVFGFHLLPDAFDRLVPPWENVTIVRRADISQVGSQTILETKMLGPIKVRWVAEHTVYDPPRMFEDVQVKGPFKQWRHRHIIIPERSGSIMRDDIDFVPPMAIFGALAAPAAILPRLEKMFTFRHEVTRRWCENGE